MLAFVSHSLGRDDEGRQKTGIPVGAQIVAQSHAADAAHMPMGGDGRDAMSFGHLCCPRFMDKE